jgi:apolipoprotein N-acyltransferase
MLLMPRENPDEAMAPAGRALTLALWLAPAASAVLLYLSYFPVAWGWLAWVALVPLLVLVRLPGRPRRLYLACWVGGLLFHWPVLQWVRVADWMMYGAWAVVATYGAFYWPVGLALLRWFSRRTPLPLVLTFPVVWVALEFVRWGLAGCFVSLLIGSHQHDVPGGFGWYILGHTQHDYLAVIQISDLAGAYGVTFLVAAVNALVFEVLAAGGWFRRLLLQGEPARWRPVALVAQGLVVVGLLGGALVYGQWRLDQPAGRSGPRIALVQTNLDQRLRNTTISLDEEQRAAAQKGMAENFADLVMVAARYRPGLIITPETSYPGVWQELAPGKPGKYSQKLARAIGDRLGAPVLLGMTAEVMGHDLKERSYNSAILIGSDGRWLGRYDKMHRVPFGEYIPLGSWLPFLWWFTPYHGTSWAVSPGEQFTRFALPGRGGAKGCTFGVLVCYEDTDPALARPYGGGGQEPVDFVVNASNDGWFDGTSEHDQHLAICRFRAVECRRSVVRSVNMGISGVIDSNGRVLAPQLVRETPARVWEVTDPAESLPVQRWGEFKKAAGVILARVPLDDRVSFYARHGDLFAGSCLGVVFVLGLGLRMTRRRAGR